MKMAKYYVVTKSNWQGDSWSPVAGPFRSKKEAQNQVSAHENHPHQMTGGIDLKNQVHAKVVSRTWLARNGFRSDHSLRMAVLSSKHDMVY